MATFVMTLVGGIVGLVAGWCAGALAGMVIAAVTRMANFEGAAGYFVVFLCGPIGAVLGLVAGVWLTLFLRGTRASLSAVALHSTLSLGALLAVAAGVIVLKLSLDDTLNRNAAKPQALFEIRLPPGTTLPANRRDINVELHSDQNVASAYLHDAWRSDGDRPVISGGVELAFRTSQRLLVLKIRDEPDRLFALKLAGKPGHADAFGSWQPIDYIEDGAPHLRRATPTDQYDIRYRSRDPNVEFTRPILEFECTLPATPPLPDDPKAINVQAVEAQNTMDGTINAESIRRDHNRLTLGGTIQLAGDTHSMVAISLPNHPTQLFEIQLPQRPWFIEAITSFMPSPAEESPAFGPWQSVAFIRAPGQMETRPAPSQDDAQLRYRLR